MAIDPDVVAAWVRASCAAQGVPEKVEDRASLAAVATLLGLAGAGPERTGRQPRAPRRLAPTPTGATPERPARGPALSALASTLA